jgi:hypothetical protein
LAGQAFDILNGGEPSQVLLGRELPDPLCPLLEVGVVVAMLLQVLLELGVVVLDDLQLLLY